jgi:hypothetical protein
MIRIEKSLTGNWTVLFKTEDTVILLSSDKLVRPAIIEAAKRLTIAAAVNKKDGKFEASCGILRLKAVGETPTHARDRLRILAKMELDRLPLIN